MLGWFSSDIHGLTDSTQLKARIIFQDDGFRPFIELEPTDHPLAVCQREGIDPKRAAEIHEYYEHPA
jgi:hypothetical protein